MHKDELAVQFLLHLSNHAQGESDIDSMRLADIVEASSEFNRTLPLLQQPALESAPEEWRKALSALWENPSFLAWAHDHTGEVERQGDRMEGNFQTRITNMIVRCFKEVKYIQEITTSDGHTAKFAAFLETLTATLRGEVAQGPSNERDQRAEQALAGQSEESQW